MLLAILAAISLQIGLSFMAIVAMYALGFGLSPRVLVAARLGVASAILTPLALIFERHTRPPMTARIFAMILIMSVFEPMLEQNLFYAGMQLTSPTFASGMFNLLPAIMFVMACIFRLEKVSIHSRRGQAKIVGTVVAIGGAMTMTFWRGHVIPLPWTSSASAVRGHVGHQDDVVRGGLLLVSSCLSWSFYVILQAKVVVSYPARLSLTALICTLGTVGSLLTALVWDRHSPYAWKAHPDVTLLAVLFGGCFSAATVYVVGWLAKTRGPLFVSIFNPVNLISTAIISSIVLSEQMFLGRILGAFVIIGGISAVLWGKAGEQPPQPPQPEPQPEPEPEPEA